MYKSIIQYKYVLVTILVNYYYYYYYFEQYGIVQRFS